jgi:hypothetical protein
VFKGTILALASITVTTGAAVEGRLLARTAAVTLDSNIIGLAIPGIGNSGTTAPTVSATVPANAATGVSISGNVAATFSEAFDSWPAGLRPLAGPAVQRGLVAVVPGRLDEQASRMSIARLRQAAARVPVARGVLARHQAERGPGRPATCGSHSTSTLC